jgi:hypothetical protein
MESKKINQLATAVSPSTSDLAIIGDPVTGVSKKITWLQVSTLIGTAANLQQVTDNGATTTNPVTIGGLTITGLSTGVLKSDSGVISSVPFGAANGVATLAGDGKVPSNQLPSYVDDVVEVANYAALPVTGETGKIYITLDNNKVYRWGGSVYVEVAANQAVWGSITGTLANQTDLQNVLDLKATDSLVVHLAGTETITGTKTFSNPSKNDGGILLKNGASYSLSGYMNLGGMTDGLRFTSGGGISNFFTLPSSVGYTYTFPALSGTIVAISGGNSTQYIDGTGALQTFPTLVSSDNLVKLVRNQSGATMTAGTIVYISGATGNKPLITKAIATSDATSAQTFGLVQANIANNADGYVVIIGNIGDLDTSALTEGQQLYLSGTTAGAWTTTKPYAPTHLVYVGIVLRSHPNQGIIGVKIQNGYEMDELHNVDAQSPSNNDILSYNTTTSLWEHKQIATTLGFTPISLASLSATSPLIYNNGTGAFSIQVATASQNGYLSSTDWSTFNNKQAALGGTGFVKISGSTISYDNSTYYLASNPSGFITLASLSAGAGISYSNTTGVISSTITQYTDALARAAISSSATGLTYTSATGVFSLTAGYAIPTTAKQTEWDTAYTNRITSLTTTGTSGAATLVANTLNIPNYGSALSGYVPYTGATTNVNLATRTLTASILTATGIGVNIDGDGTGGGALNLKNYNSISSAGTGYTSIFAQASDRVVFQLADTLGTKYVAFLFGNLGWNSQRYYGLPNADGTFALTSDIPSLTGYVPYTGATTDVDLGTRNLSSGWLFSNGNGGSNSGVVSLKIGTSIQTTSGYGTIGAATGQQFVFASVLTGSYNKVAYLNLSALTDSTARVYSLPDATGTIALTSNLSSYVPYTGATAQLNMGDNGILVGTTTAANNIRVLCSSGNGLTAETAGCKLMLEPQSLILTDKQFSNFTKTLIFRAGGLSASYTLTLPDATGTIALTSDIPSLSGYVPYSGATGAVSLGAYGITARTANITSTGGSDAVIIYQDGNYGGGIGLNYGTNPNHMVLYYNSITALKINTSGNSTFGGTATATALTAQTAATGVGRITLNSGDATHSGYINWFNSSITRLGYMGFNNTDIELTLEGSTTFKVTGGAAVFSSSLSVGTSITAQSGYFAQDVVGDPAYIRVRNLNTGGYSSSMAFSLYGYNGTAAYFDVLKIRASYPGYGKVDFLVKGQSTSADISALSIDATNGAATFINTGSFGNATLNGAYFVIKGANGVPATSGTTTNAVLRLSSGTGLYNVLDFGTNEASDYSWIQSTRANSLGTYDNLLIQPNGGRVGINTTSPSSSVIVTINDSSANGDIALFKTAATKADIWLQDANTSAGSVRIRSESNKLQFTSGGDVTMTLTAARLVGINNLNPQARLDLGGGYGASGEKFFIYNDNNSSALAGTKVGFYMDRFGLANNSTYVFPTAAAAPGSYIISSKDTGGTTLVARVAVLGESGNVGIGQINPSILLDLKRAHASGYGNFVTLINLNGHFPGYDVDAQRAGISAGCPNMGNTTYGMIGFETRGSDGYLNRMTINGTGNILIGHVSENSFGSARSIQINGAGGSLLETRYNGTSGVRIGSGSDHAYMHDPRNAEMRFATSDSTRFYIYGNGNYSFTGSNVSDRRAKDNISLLDITATDKIMSLEAKTYNMKNNPSQKRYGFIAQEVKQIISDLVSGNENDGYLGLDYDGLLTLTIKALQEQQKEIQILKQK